jgi:hypothetical protein
MIYILLNLLIIPCHYNKHGQKLRRANLFGTSGNPIWKVVWSLEVPAKIKIHCWRSLLGAIPCYGVLALIGTSRSHPSARCVLSTAMYKAHFLSMCSCEEYLSMRVLMREKVRLFLGHLLDKNAKAPKLSITSSTPKPSNLQSILRVENWHFL